MIVDQKKTGRKLLLKKPMLEYLNKLISADREIKTYEIINKLNEKFNIRPGVATIFRAALSIKWRKKNSQNN